MLIRFKNNKAWLVQGFVDAFSDQTHSVAVTVVFNVLYKLFDFYSLGFE